MNDPPCYSELECKVMKEQMERRSKYRLEFLRKRTDPCKHSMEAGYVFDPAIQKFVSMKVTQLDYFYPNPRTIIPGILFILPFFIYGLAAWKERKDRMAKIMSGELRYRDRLFKLQ